MMFHALKTPAVLTACLVVAAACASSQVAKQSTLATGVNVASATELGVTPQASPVDLDRLAALARLSDDRQIAAIGEAPAMSTSSSSFVSRIEPATTVTYQSAAPISLDTETEYTSESLIVVPHDSDLLEGTVYKSGASSAVRKPNLIPGTYRTIEYKN